MKAKLLSEITITKTYFRLQWELLISNSSYIFLFCSHTLISCSSPKYVAAQTHPWHPPFSFVVVPATGGIGSIPRAALTRKCYHNPVSEPCNRWNRDKGTQTNLLLCVDRNRDGEKSAEEQMSLTYNMGFGIVCTRYMCRRNLYIN